MPLATTGVTEGGQPLLTSIARATKSAPPLNMRLSLKELTAALNTSFMFGRSPWCTLKATKSEAVKNEAIAAAPRAVLTASFSLSCVTPCMNLVSWKRLPTALICTPRWNAPEKSDQVSDDQNAGMAIPGCALASRYLATHALIAVEMPSRKPSYTAFPKTSGFFRTRKRATPVIAPLPAV